MQTCIHYPIARNAYCVPPHISLASPLTPAIVLLTTLLDKPVASHLPESLFLPLVSCLQASLTLKVQEASTNSLSNKGITSLSHHALDKHPRAAEVLAKDEGNIK